MRIILGLLIVLLSFSLLLAQDTIQSNQEGLNLGDVKFGKPFKKLRDPSKLRFGVTISPLISWGTQKSDEIARGKLRGGVEYGGILEYYFTSNIGLSTGLSVLYNGANLIYKDSADIRTFNTDKPTTALFKFQYMTIPVSLKLKSNQVGYFTYYGELGFLTGFCIEAKVDAQNGDGTVLYDDANFLTRRNNETGEHLLSTLVNFSLHVGGGFEYAINDRSALLFGLTYNNGFVKVVQDVSGRSITLANVGLKVGVLF
jgi:hypothetical protein